MLFSAEEEVNNTKNFRLMKTVMIIMKSIIQVIRQATVQFEQLTITITNDHIDLSHVVQDADQSSLDIVEVRLLDIPPIVRGGRIRNIKENVKNIIS